MEDKKCIAKDIGEFLRLLGNMDEQYSGIQWVERYFKWINEKKVYKHASKSQQTLNNHKRMGYYKGKELLIYNNEKRTKILEDTQDSFDDFHSYMKKIEKEDLKGTYWAVYFFYNQLGVESSVFIGRAKAFFDKGNEVRLDNIKDNVSLDKLGDYEYGDDRSFVSINMKSVENDDLTLHIKLKKIRNFDKSEMMLGSYISYEDHTVTSGSIVFHKIKNNLEYRNLKVGIYSLLKNKKEFNDIPKEIRAFLSRRSDNYIKIPKNIFTKKDLQKKMDYYSSSRRYINRFISPKKFNIYIGSPNTSLSEEIDGVKSDKSEYKKHEKNIENLKVRLESIVEAKIADEEKASDYIEIHHRINRDKKNIKTISLPKIVSILKKTDLFILFYFGSSTSTSLIELGMALCYAKQIVVFHKGDLPFKMRIYLDDNGIRKEKYEDFDEVLMFCKRPVEKMMGL